MPTWEYWTGKAPDLHGLLDGAHVIIRPYAGMSGVESYGEIASTSSTSSSVEAKLDGTIVSPVDNENAPCSIASAEPAHLSHLGVGLQPYGLPDLSLRRLMPHVRVFGPAATIHSHSGSATSNVGVGRAEGRSCR